MKGFGPLTVLTIGFAIFLVYAFPGYMSTDSELQLLEARSGVFSDGHPPLMAAEWWVLDRIFSGPILMLLLQGVLFLGGLYFLFERKLSPRTAAWTAIAILLFPPVLTPMAVIWKDSQMAAYLVAGTAALLQPRLRLRLLGLGLLVAACLMRHNALVAAVPIIGFVFEWRKPLAWWKRLGIMFAAGLLALGALFGVSRVLAKNHVRLTPVFHDILGMIAFTDDRTDADLEQVLRGTPLAVHTGIQAHARHLFGPGFVWRVVGGDDRFFDYPTTDEQWSALYRAWKELAANDPGSYLGAHWDIFRGLLGVSQLPRAPVYDLFLETEEAAVEVAHNASPSWLQHRIARWFYWLADHTPLFRPWVFAVIALLLLALCCRDRLTFALLTSGLLYELSFMPAFAEADFRYSHWMITSTTLAAVILFIERRKAAR